MSALVLFSRCCGYNLVNGCYCYLFFVLIEFLVRELKIMAIWRHIDAKRACVHRDSFMTFASDGSVSMVCFELQYIKFLSACLVVSISLVFMKHSPNLLYHMPSCQDSGQDPDGIWKWSRV